MVSGAVIVGVLGWAGSWERVLLVPFVGLVMGLGARAGAMGSRPMVRLGEASYSLYLLHLPLWPWGMALNAATVQWPMDSWGFVVLCFGVSLGGAWAAYHYVEEPYRRALRGAPRGVRSGTTGAEGAG
ncbi:MAG: hypothetical protein NTX13_07660 [Acidobacteria bacterium]|nr:hypothetical protein [Acidobacteriota bacterium]